MDVIRDKLTLHTGSVGKGRWESTSTYVLVDARNTGDVDLEITLAGELLDVAGESAGELHRDSIRVPRGGVRMFALVAKDYGAHPDAVGARVDIVGATRLDYPEPVVIEEGNVFRDGERLVVSGYARNTRKGRARVLVIGGFYDSDGRPMKRPYTDLKIDGEQKFGLQLAGPEGAHSGYLFVGQLAY